MTHPEALTWPILVIDLISNRSLFFFAVYYLSDVSIIIFIHSSTLTVATTTPAATSPTSPQDDNVVQSEDVAVLHKPFRRVLTGCGNDSCALGRKRGKSGPDLMRFSRLLPKVQLSFLQPVRTRRNGLCDTFAF